jgi:hypothetical protein
VGGANLALASPTLSDTLARAGHAYVEVHAVDTRLSQRPPTSNPKPRDVPNARVVLDAQIDVFADTEPEVARLAEVALAEFIFLDLEATLENFLGLGATDGNVDGNSVEAVNLLCSLLVVLLYAILLVPPDTKSTDSVAGFAVDGSLTAQLLEHLSRTGEAITRLADGNVKNKLLDAKLAHGVGSFGVGLCTRLAP